MSKDDVLKTLQDGPHGEEAWENFHEASKTSRFDPMPDMGAVRAKMARSWPSFPYSGYPSIALPLPGPLDHNLGEAMRARATSRDLCSASVSLEDLSTLLFNAYGETRDETASGYPRKFRTVPSGGAMYPLELYLHATRVEGLKSGVYHYCSSGHKLHVLSEGDATRRLGAALVQSRIALEAAFIVFISAVPERSVYKYGERGYRFALLEAGHVAQNFVLASAALGGGAVTIGGYFDAEIDALLGFDGLRQSVVYMLAYGGRGGDNWVGT